MKIIEPPPPSGESRFAIDYSKPIIHFDPWPFVADAVKLDRGWFIDDDGDLDSAGPALYTLHDGTVDGVLGVATDGRPFVTSPEGLKAWQSAE